MINDYLGSIVLTLVPPLWFKLMKKRLANWDENFASPQELELLKAPNASSKL